MNTTKTLRKSAWIGSKLSINVTYDDDDTLVQLNTRLLFKRMTSPQLYKCKKISKITLLSEKCNVQNNVKRYYLCGGKKKKGLGEKEKTHTYKYRIFTAFVHILSIQLD